MLDLLKTFRADVMLIEEERSAALFKQASKHLQDIYNFHLTAKNSFTEVEYELKSLYTSFNYGAVIINDALKKKKLDAENGVMLEECLETMLTCCDVIKAKLTQKPKPAAKKTKK